MLSGLPNLGVLVASAIALLVAVDAFREVSDVELRIAERNAIPHYIRHGYEYPDINIKQIMLERGITVKPYYPINHSNRDISHNYVRPNYPNRKQAWMLHNKLSNMGNHVPRGNLFYLKRLNYLKNMNAGNKHYKLKKY